MQARDDILRKFDAINVWSRGSERAPHKPLLLLYALGRLTRGEGNSMSFRDVAPKLTTLLQEFGPWRRTYHPEFPFWRLQNDGIWIVENADQIRRRTGRTDVTKKELLEKDVHARFADEIDNRLRGDPSLVADIALRLLDGHFPVSLHQDILDAVGLELSLTEIVTRRKRDPEFRVRILGAYEFACAVCGFDVRLGSQVLGLEAAHIQWHQAGGPDEVTNGLTLCSLHHKASDLGAFTVQPGLTLLVSEQVYGRQGFDEWLLKFHGYPIRAPQRDTYLPAEKFLRWHEKEVFKQPPRTLPGI